MRLSKKGQVTIPAPLRLRHGLRAGDEVEVVEDPGGLLIVPVGDTRGRGDRLVQGLRGRATTPLTTDQLLRLLRDE